MKISLKIFCFLFVLNMRSSDQNLFEMNPDKIIENIIGQDFYKAKANLHKPKLPFAFKQSEIPDGEDFGNETRKIIDRSHNITAKEANFRRIKLQLDLILGERHKELPKFDPEIDHIEQTTRRFNKIRNKIMATRRSLQENTQQNLKSSRRFSEETMQFLHGQKPRLYSLMETFIYVCRSKLPYTQALRSKYIHSLRFRIGYIFANIRTIMEQMNWLYSMMARTYDNFAAYVTFHFFLQMYEAMVKYEMDVTDLIDYVTRLEYDRKMIYDPDYYDERPWKEGQTEP